MITVCDSGVRVYRLRWISLEGGRVDNGGFMYLAVVPVVRLEWSHRSQIAMQIRRHRGCGLMLVSDL